MHAAHAMCLINGTKPDARRNLATGIEVVDGVASAEIDRIG